MATSVYRKPTSTNALLNWYSGHPMTLKKSIPKGQYLRLRHNGSSELYFHEQAQDLRQRFRERGYPDRILQKAYRNALSRERSTLLTHKLNNDNDSVMRVTGIFDEASGPIRTILTRHWGILNLDPDIRDLVGTRPQSMYKRGPSRYGE